MVVTYSISRSTKYLTLSDLSVRVNRSKMAEQTMELLSSLNEETRENAANYDEHPAAEIARTSENYSTKLRLD